jgi:hypothetical protein
MRKASRINLKLNWCAYLQACNFKFYSCVCLQVHDLKLYWCACLQAHNLKLYWSTYIQALDIKLCWCVCLQVFDLKFYWCPYLQAFHLKFVDVFALSAKPQTLLMWLVSSIISSSRPPPSKKLWQHLDKLRRLDNNDYALLPLQTLKHVFSSHSNTRNARVKKNHKVKFINAPKSVHFWVFPYVFFLCQLLTLCFWLHLMFSMNIVYSP